MFFNDGLEHIFEDGFCTRYRCDDNHYDKIKKEKDGEGNSNHHKKDERKKERNYRGDFPNRHRIHKREETKSKRKYKKAAEYYSHK